VGINEEVSAVRDAAQALRCREAAIASSMRCCVSESFAAVPSLRVNVRYFAKSTEPS
jgi:hypothetical protein